MNTDPKVSEVAANPHIQTAIRYALDYPSFVKLSGPGAVQAPGMIPSMFIGHLPPTARIKRNLPKARAEVTASGIANPKIRIDYPTELTINGISFATLAQKTAVRTSPRSGSRSTSREARRTRSSRPTRGQGADGPLVLGPGLPGPERLPRLHAGRLVAANRVNWGVAKDPKLDGGRARRRSGP